MGVGVSKRNKSLGIKLKQAKSALWKMEQNCKLSLLGSHRHGEAVRTMKIQKQQHETSELAFSTLLKSRPAVIDAFGTWVGKLHAISPDIRKSWCKNFVDNEKLKTYLREALKWQELLRETENKNVEAFCWSRESEVLV